MTGIAVRPAVSEADLDDVRRLCRDYRAALVAATRDRPEIAETYYAAGEFETLLADLPNRHAPPDGAIWLGTVAGAPRGCGMIHHVGPATCEIKRVFVADDARGTGLGKAIVAHAMAEARARGYARMVLDTMRPLVPAARLYERLGFAPCPPFYEVDPEFANYILFYGRDL
ncbi:GNAT family N-acetyltransferase [Rhodobacterales bacterium HKCCE2091]|nr:GNAT family N-acetyltransferase [Rhodobacterales bacterium HKCCE2091]